MAEARKLRGSNCILEGNLRVTLDLEISLQWFMDSSLVLQALADVRWFRCTHKIITVGICDI